MVQGKKNPRHVDRSKTAAAPRVEGSEQSGIEVETILEVKVAEPAVGGATAAASAAPRVEGSEQSGQESKSVDESRIFADAGLSGEQIKQCPELADMARRGYAWIAGEWRRPETHDVTARQGTDRDRLARQRQVAEAYDARTRVYDRQPGSDPAAN